MNQLRYILTQLWYRQYCALDKDTTCCAPQGYWHCCTRRKGHTGRHNQRGVYTG